jgi:hypothetical protein
MHKRSANEGVYQNANKPVARHIMPLTLEPQSPLANTGYF